MFLSEIAVSLLVRLWVEISLSIVPKPEFSSASLWGCELKYHWDVPPMYKYIVSLLVRLWVEIIQRNVRLCRNFVSLLVRLWVEIWKKYGDTQPTVVSLLVRLWVEMSAPHGHTGKSLSASLWGCELKFNSMLCVVSGEPGQPPCEAVSWNRIRAKIQLRLGRSASLWGCELKYWKQLDGKSL